MFRARLFLGVFLATFFVVTSVFAITPHMAPYGFVRIGAFSQASGGAYVADVENPVAAYANPACIVGNRVYLEMAKRLKSDYWGDIAFDNAYYDGQFIYPTYLSGNYNFRDFANFSIGYMNYNNDYFGDEWERTGSEGNPAGTSETKETIKTHVFFGALQKAFSSKFSVGLTAGFNYLKEENEYEGISMLNSDGSGSGVLLIAGMLFRPAEPLYVGATFRYLNKIDYDVEGIDKTSYTAEFPWSAQLGFSYTIRDIKLLAMIDFQKWSDIEYLHVYGVDSVIRDEGNFDDKIQIHLGSQIPVNDNLEVAVGFFTHDDPIIFGDYFVSGVGVEYFEDYIDQKFVSAGFRWKANDKYSFYFSVIDAHLFKNDGKFYQTQFSFGASYLY